MSEKRQRLTSKTAEDWIKSKANTQTSDKGSGIDNDTAALNNPEHTKNDPKVDQYAKGDPSAWAEDVNKSDLWKKDKRDPEMHVPEITAKDASEAVASVKKLQEKAVKCLVASQRILPGAPESVIEAQASDLMHLPETRVDALLKRQQDLAQAISKAASDSTDAAEEKDDDDKKKEKKEEEEDKEEKKEEEEDKEEKKEDKEEKKEEKKEDKKEDKEKDAGQNDPKYFYGKGKKDKVKKAMDILAAAMEELTKDEKDDKDACMKDDKEDKEDKEAAYDKDEDKEDKDAAKEEKDEEDKAATSEEKDDKKEDKEAAKTEEEKDEEDEDKAAAKEASLLDEIFSSALPSENKKGVTKLSGLVKKEASEGSKDISSLWKSDPDVSSMFQ